MMEHGTQPVIAESDTHMRPPSPHVPPEKEAFEDCGSGNSRTLPRDGGQSGFVSTTSPSSKNGAAEDPNETPPFVGTGL